MAIKIYANYKKRLTKNNCEVEAETYEVANGTETIVIIIHFVALIV